VNRTDPIGLCDVPSGDPNRPFTHTHNGTCTVAEAYLIKTQANAIRQGTSIYGGEAAVGGGIGLQFNPLQGAEGGLNFIGGVENSVLKFGEFIAHATSLHNINIGWSIGPSTQQCQTDNPFVASDYQAGNNVGTVLTNTPNLEARLAEALTVDIYVHILKMRLAG